MTADAGVSPEDYVRSSVDRKAVVLDGDKIESSNDCSEDLPDCE